MKDILIVEDGIQERERLERLFTQSGFAVVACETVAEAEDVLQREVFRLAILDIGLNDKSGSYLFNKIKGSSSVSYVMIFTGNPSVHLKQRFLDEGAVDYIVKASSQAGSEQLLARVKDLLGELSASSPQGMPLDELLKLLPEKSKQLFLEMDGSYPECASCGARSYVVTFSHETQMPPDISGKVVCENCAAAMDPEIG